jgi:cytochrome P450
MTTACSFAVCLGKGLAMLEIKLGLAMILDVFETPVPKWEGHERNATVPYQMTVTHPTKHGMHVGLKLRTKK